MTSLSTPRSTKVLWALVLISLAYNVYNFLSSNEAISQQLNLNRSQASASYNLRLDLNDLDARIYDLEDQIGDLERSHKRRMNSLEQDLSLIQSELEDHRWYGH